MLTKYEAEKEISFYHWEVVEADGCCCASAAVGGVEHPACRCVYKPAPPEANLGDVFDVTAEERGELVAWHPAVQQDASIQLATAETTPKTAAVEAAAVEAAAASMVPPVQPVTVAMVDAPPPTELAEEASPSLWRRVASRLRMPKFGKSTDTENAASSDVAPEAPAATE